MRVTRDTQAGSIGIVVLTTTLVNVPVPSTTTGDVAPAWRSPPARSTIEVTIATSAAHTYRPLVLFMASSPLNKDVGLLGLDCCSESRVIRAEHDQKRHSVATSQCGT